MIKVKKEFQKTVVGFGSSGLPLGQRDDLHQLLNDVIGDDDQVINDHIANMFETPLPKKAELKKLLEADMLKKADEVKLSAKAQKAQEIIKEAEQPDPTILAPERPSDEVIETKSTKSKKK